MQISHTFEAVHHVSPAIAVIIPVIIAVFISAHSDYVVAAVQFDARAFSHQAVTTSM